jgi:CheY-like chemotaxis protein
MHAVTDATAKRALIVDDSRSARGFLSRILQKHEIEVDTAESAELALEYLTHTQPDVIFMDHLMPGMDGFQAVQSIKNNPRTATIPIMMYTSQEGELYLGQARALGAVGVLPKQVKPAEVSTVLYQLRVLPDRRHNGPSGFEPGNAAAEHALAVAPESMSATAAPAHADAAAPDAGAPGHAAQDAVHGANSAAPRGAELRPVIEESVRQQLVEFRRTFMGLLDQNSDRLLADMRTAVGEALRDGGFVPASQLEPERTPRSRLPALLAVAAAAIAALFAVLWWREAQSNQQLVAQLVAAQVAANARVEAAVTAPAAGTEAGAASGAEPVGSQPAAADLATGAASAPGGMPAAATPGVTPSAPSVPPATAAAGGTPSAAHAVAATLPRDSVQLVPYGEVPVAGERLELLRRQLDELLSAGFRGVVTITSFPGRFCLVGNAAEGYAPAAAEVAVDKCDLLGNPFDEALAPAQREPLALANLIGAIRQRSAGALEIRLAAGAESVRASAYPAAAPALKAGEWNRAAENNNRLEIRIKPAAT